MARGKNKVAPRKVKSKKAKSKKARKKKTSGGVCRCLPKKHRTLGIIGLLIVTAWFTAWLTLAVTHSGLLVASNELSTSSNLRKLAKIPEAGNLIEEHPLDAAAAVPAAVTNPNPVAAAAFKPAVLSVEDLTINQMSEEDQALAAKFAQARGETFLSREHAAAKTSERALHPQPNAPKTPQPTPLLTRAPTKPLPTPPPPTAPPSPSATVPLFVERDSKELEASKVPKCIRVKRNHTKRS